MAVPWLLVGDRRGGGCLEGLSSAPASGDLQWVPEAWCVLGGAIEEAVAKGSYSPGDSRQEVFGAGLAGPLETRPL